MGRRIEPELFVRKFTRPENLAGRGSVEPDACASKRSESARILVVDDQEDLRRMLATALELEGYEVDEAASAHEGLRRLRAIRYQLVLTDYAMPGGTGTWMLREASRLGLMTHTVALVVTAHPDARDLYDTAVISKSLELDQFLQHVHTILESSSPSGSARQELAFHACGRADKFA